MIKKMTAAVVSILMMFAAMGCGDAGIETTENTETKVIKESEHRASGVAASTASVTSEDTESVEVKPLDVQELEVSVWYPYWDNETAEEELGLFGSDCDTICFFAAYYDKDNVAFIPEDTIDTFGRLLQKGSLSGKKTYLSFVNDKLLEKGSSLKDTELLYALLGDDEKAMQHARDCIELAKDLGCEGVEIDYEAIKKDENLWKCFNSFTHIMAKEAEAEGMPLRIVFEPSAPLESFDWPSYPEYVMMCYNLYGFGTKAGPKADFEFIENLASKMKSLPGEANMAFANGGFDFAEDGSVKQINLHNITEILKANDITPVRDDSSGDMFFDYTDDQGVSHEIWYADQETLKLWMQTSQNNGINRVSVWRLGGNL